MTLKRPQLARQHVTIRDPIAGKSRTFTTYESTFEQTVERVTDAIGDGNEQTKTPRPKAGKR